MSDQQPPQWGSDQPPPPPAWGTSPPPPPIGGQSGWQAAPPPYMPPPFAGQARNEGTAIAAMVCGIVGLLFCGVVLGIVALSLGFSAKRKIEQSNGQLGGAGMATTGIVLGILDLVLGVAFLLLIVGRS